MLTFGLFNGSNIQAYLERAGNGFEAMRDIIHLACGECKRRNYSTTKNKKKTTDRLEFKKYCRFCRQHTPHKETK